MTAKLSTLAATLLTGASLLLAAAPATAATAAPATGVVEAGRCDHACLVDMVNQYLAAMIAHDPERLPLRQGVKFTENGQTLRLGDGLWGTIEGLGDFRMDFADPVGGQVGYFGTVKESGRLVEMSLRLKVVGKKISEVETLVVRSTSMSGGDGMPVGNLAAKPIFNEILPPAQRRPRDEMVAIANSYFEGLEQATGKITPFEPACQRIEGSMVTSNDPTAPAGSIQKLSCGAQFDLGFSPFITEVRGRRFVVVDEERGLVFAMLSFDHAGKIKSVKLTDGTTMKVPAPFDAPFSFLMGELFKIRDGKIAQVQAVISTTPYAMPSGW